MSAARSEQRRRADAVNEPDRLAGFAAPREVAELFGHEAARSEFAASLASGRLHHGWLISGPEGIGKATLAYLLARELLAENAHAANPHDPTSPLFAQVAGKAHPNLLVLNRALNEKTGRYSQWISVEAVRRLRAFLAGTPSQKGWRVAIIDRADEMNLSAANALLKALEEPPERTVFLLVAGAEGRLPVTIRSRCRALRLQPLARPVLRQAVEAALAREGAEVEPGALETALALSGGSVRAALSLATGDAIALYQGLLAAFGKLPRLDEAWLHGLADRLSQPESFTGFFDLLLGLMERLVRIAATGAGSSEGERALADKLGIAGNLGAWAELHQSLGEALGETLTLNLDKGLLLFETFARLQALAAPQRI